MAAVRRDITANELDADRFVQAPRPQGRGERAARQRIAIDPGSLAADRDLSTWDLFVVWHVWAMDQMSSTAGATPPIWARCSCRGTGYLLVLEANMRRVLGVGPRLRAPVLGLGGRRQQPHSGARAHSREGVAGGRRRRAAEDRQVIDGPFTAAQFDVRSSKGRADACGRRTAA